MHRTMIPSLMSVSIIISANGLLQAHSYTTSTSPKLSSSFFTTSITPCCRSTDRISFSTSRNCATAFSSVSVSFGETSVLA
uniref:Putative secreted protein n=1 Tax=Anopheles triannulatus TaxID=58253 RepID=A0A2M4B6E5_9DIPT